LLLLRRGWADSWDFDAAEFDAVENDVERLFGASARPDHGLPASAAASSEAVLNALRADLDVRAALDIAYDAGGSAARTLVEILGLR
jgi:cysteinyl-tRNA synthetase